MHGVGRRRDRVEHGVERVVVDLDELGRVLGEVAVAGDDDGDRLADVAHGVDRGGVLRHAGLDPGREGPRERGDVRPGEHADDAGRRERRRGVDLDPRVGELRAHDRGVERAGDGGEIVEEPALAAQQRVVLDPQHAAADPGRRPRSRDQAAPSGVRHAANVPPLSADAAPRRAPPASSPGPPSSSARNASSTARGSRPWRSAAIVSGSRTAPPQWAHGQ